MKYQTNPELGPFINAWGCHICCILEKVEKVSGYAYSFTNEAILEVYRQGMADGFIQKEIKDDAGNPVDGCDVLDGVGFFNLAAQYAGIPHRLKSYMHVGVDFCKLEVEEEILKCAYPGHAGFHFMSGNGIKSNPWQGEIEFDPIEGGSHTAKFGDIIEKRILVFA